MASIQGISGVGAASAAYGLPKTTAPAAPKPEARETALDESGEQARGAQEASETRSTNPNLGTRFSALA